MAGGVVAIEGVDGVDLVPRSVEPREGGDNIGRECEWKIKEVGSAVGPRLMLVRSVME